MRFVYYPILSILVFAALTVYYVHSWDVSGELVSSTLSRSSVQLSMDIHCT